MRNFHYIALVKFIVVSSMHSLVHSLSLAEFHSPGAEHCIYIQEEETEKEMIVMKGVEPSVPWGSCWMLILEGRNKEEMILSRFLSFGVMKCFSLSGKSCSNKQNCLFSFLFMTIALFYFQLIAVKGKVRVERVCLTKSSCLMLIQTVLLWKLNTHVHFFLLMIQIVKQTKILICM